MNLLRFCLLLSVSLAFAPGVSRAQEPALGVTTLAAANNAAAPGTSDSGPREKGAVIPGNLAEKELADLTALTDFYAARKGAALWVTDTGFSAKARALAAEIKNAGAYGLDAKDFNLPDMPESSATAPATEQLAGAESQLTMAALKYARFARGGRIPDPAAQLTTCLLYTSDAADE